MDSIDTIRYICNGWLYKLDARWSREQVCFSNECSFKLCGLQVNFWYWPVESVGKRPPLYAIVRSLRWQFWRKDAVQSLQKHGCTSQAWSVKSGCDVPSLKLTARTWKWMVGIRWFPFGARPIFRGFSCLFQGVFHHFFSSTELLAQHLPFGLETCPGIAKCAGAQ